MSFILKEEIHPDLLNSLYSNFSNSTEAILELIDNSVSDRIPGKPLEIEIGASKNRLVIINRNGLGMGLNGLISFFNWGKQKDRRALDIGRYGQGGKSALGYLGEKWLLVTCAAGEKKEWQIQENKWSDRSNGLKIYKPRSRQVSYNEGLVHFEIRDLKRKINEVKLKEEIMDAYRPLILSGDVVIRYNGDVLKPEPYPLDRDFKIEKFEIELLADKVIKGWIGRRAERSELKGGIRCYSKGRLVINEQFFGHPDPRHKGTLNYLFGEVHLDFVPMNMNKTDFDRDSEDWESIHNFMFARLKPHIDELLGRKIEEVTKEEIDRVKNTKDIFDVLQKMRNKQNLEIAGNDTNSNMGLPEILDKYLPEIALGQKQPEPNVEIDAEKPNLSETKRKNEPATPPPSDSMGKRKRRKPFMGGMDWDIRPMPEYIRSTVLEEAGKKTLIINSNFPAYKAFKGHELYLLETATMQVVKIEKEDEQSLQEYLDDFDELYGYYCANFEVAKENLKKRRKI